MLLFFPKIANIADDFGVFLMMGFKKWIVTACVTVLPVLGFAQFDSQRSQYMYGITAYNPGAVAQNEMCNVLGIYRLQWAGFSGAPKDVVVSADVPLTIAGTSHGIGVDFQSEDIGVFKKQAFALQYAYQMQLWRGKLGLGLDLGCVSQGVKGDLDFTGRGESGDDQNMPNTSNDDFIGGGSADFSDMAFNVGFGAFYSDESLYFGLSFLNLNRPSFETDKSKDFDIPRLMYIVGGYDLPLSNEDYHLKPSALFRTDFSTSQLDLSCLADYKGKYSGGLGYRLGDSFEFLVGANLINGLFLGYAYDLPVSGMIKSGGSHEVCLKYSFKLELAKKNKYKSERIL